MRSLVAAYAGKGAAPSTPQQPPPPPPPSQAQPRDPTPVEARPRSPARAAVAPAALLSAADVHAELERRLPPEPPQTDVDPALLAKVAGAAAKGQSIVARLRGNTAFKNPETIGQLVTFVDIDERGSNYPPERFDPRHAKALPNYKQLADTQNAYLATLAARETSAVTGLPEVQWNREGKRPSDTAPSAQPPRDKRKK